MRGFQIWSQNRAGIIFDPYFGQKKRQNTPDPRFQRVLGVFFGQYRGKILSELNSETMFGILSSRRIFQTLQYEENLGKCFCFLFFKLYLVREQKSSF